MTLFTFFRPVFAILLMLCAHEVYAAAYAQLSTLHNQVPDPAKPKTVIMENVDMLQGMSKNSRSDQLTVNEEGTYFVLAAVQVGTQDQTKATAYSGYIDVWITHNGQVVSGSKSRQYVINVNNSAAVLISQSLLHLKAGDTVSVYFYSQNPAIGLVTIPGTDKRSTIPGITFSMFKV